MKKIPLLLLLLLPFAGRGLRAQSYDLANDRVPLASLDGLWRFHTGDDPAWADPDFDDSKWPLLRSDKDWSSQGYNGYGGMAWYRFHVNVPAGVDHLSLYLPQIRTCYEVYADGKLIGTYGKMPPSTFPYIGGGSYRAYLLPAVSGKAGKIGIALRVWHWPGWAKYRWGGPQYGGGLVGDTNEINLRTDLDRADLFRDGTSYLVLGLMETLAGLGALTLFVLRRQQVEYLYFSLFMFLTSVAAWIAMSTVFDVWNVGIRDLTQQPAVFGAAFASIAFYRRMLNGRNTWLLKLAVASIAIGFLDNVIAHLPGMNRNLGFHNFIWMSWQVAVNTWIIALVVTRAIQKSADARLLVVPVAASALVSSFAAAAWTTYTMGMQHQFTGSLPLTEKPFPISWDNVATALVLLSILGILILRFTRTSSQEERFAGEVQAARKVQRYLIPEHLPKAPGFTIESEYRPSREVGGDFFQVLPNALDGSVLIVVGDVAGKGMEAGMLATLIVGAIRTAAAFTGDPARIIALLNERLQGRGLVTCQVLRIESDGSTTLVNAGHLPPWLNGLELAVEGALPLGAIPGADFPVMHFRLNLGDSLVLMSDGIVEAQDTSGQLFGFDRIGALLRQSCTAAYLATAAQDFGQEDDITVLTVARTPLASS